MASAAGGIVIAAVWLTGGSSAQRGFAAVSPAVSGGADHSASGLRVWVARRQAANAARYVDPLRAVSGLQPGRIDMGVDYVGSGPVLALGDGRVTMASNDDSGPSSCWGKTCWPGAIVVYRLVDGAFAGKYVYVAENVTVHVHAGQRVRAGEQIAIVHDGFPYMETGWASGTGVETLAIADRHQCSCDDPGGWSTVEGQNFSSLLAMLGAPAGRLQPDAPTQHMPHGWPRSRLSAKPSSVPRSPGSMSEG
ncbi:MAG TPA: hypothetical protein VMU39_09255 [Solirubrobacteraceae bacterium]|nr:hypothetical protein [Solirubrobacteraceae bacterium]